MGKGPPDPNPLAEIVSIAQEPKSSAGSGSISLAKPDILPGGTAAPVNKVEFPITNVAGALENARLQASSALFDVVSETNDAAARRKKDESGEKSTLALKQDNPQTYVGYIQPSGGGSDEVTKKQLPAGDGTKLLRSTSDPVVVPDPGKSVVALSGSSIAANESGVREPAKSPIKNAGIDFDIADKTFKPILPNTKIDYSPDLTEKVKLNQSTYSEGDGTKSGAIIAKADKPAPIAKTVKVEEPSVVAFDERPKARTQPTLPESTFVESFKADE